MDVRRGGQMVLTTRLYRIDAASEFNHARTPHERTLTIVR